METIVQQLQKFYNGKRILITGGNGYLGSNLVSKLSDFECQILCLDKSETHKSLEKDKKADIKNIICDISDSTIWQKYLEEINLVFHFAGQTSVYVANENPVKDFNINVLPLLSMLETCKKNEYDPTILFAGTATEIGMPERLPVDEHHPDKPITIYDLHKFMAEGYLKYYANAGIVRGITLRLANVYGPGHSSSRADRGILNLMVRKALNGEDIPLYGKGENIRDYVYVEDVISAFLLSGMNIEIMNGKHYIIATGIGHSLRDAFKIVINSVYDITKKKVNLISVDPPKSLSPIESRNFIANVSSLKKSIGWIPKITLEQGINKTVKYYKSMINEKN